MTVNDTVSLSFNAETDAQIITNDGLKVATILRTILNKPGFISIQADDNVSFTDIVSLCGHDHNKIAEMLRVQLERICSAVLPYSSITADVSITEYDETDTFNIGISISDNSGEMVVQSADVESVNGKLVVIYK